MMDASIHIRPAVATDQPTIRTIVRAARINPFGLAWPRFVVAERAGVIVGVGQIRPHRDGSRELASIAVVPAAQGQGIGSLIIETLQAQARPPLFLICVAALGSYYQRFGFQTIAASAMPPALGRIAALVNLPSRIAGTPPQLLVLRWS